MFNYSYQAIRIYIVDSFVLAEYFHEEGDHCFTLVIHDFGTLFIARVYMNMYLEIIDTCFGKFTLTSLSPQVNPLQFH